MSKEMIEYIIEYKTDKSIVFCEAAGHHQPLVGIYSKKILSDIEKFISNNEISDKSFHKFLSDIDTEIIHPQSLSFYRDKIFFNVNSVDDFNELLKFFSFE
jgi:molybdopterin-guanine dinucleotide biosynthesis protein A